MKTTTLLLQNDLDFRGTISSLEHYLGMVLLGFRLSIASSHEPTKANYETSHWEIQH